MNQAARIQTRFHIALRIVHWGMALLILAMLFMGIGMVSTVAPAYPVLLALHREVGVALLVLVIVRLAIRLTTGTPPLPDDLPRWQIRAAQGSHAMLYLAMTTMPLIGWAMLSAGGYPVQVAGAVILPPILPGNIQLYSLLRGAHAAVACAFFALILAHMSAALVHALVRRDGIFASMAFGRRATGEAGEGGEAAS